MRSQSSDVSKLALGTLLKRCQEVLQNYVKDEKLSGRCPLPRSRMAEIAFVMRAISSLIGSLQARRDHMTQSTCFLFFKDVVNIRVIFKNTTLACVLYLLTYHINVRLM